MFIQKPSLNPRLGKRLKLPMVQSIEDIPLPRYVQAGLGTKDGMKPVVLDTSSTSIKLKAIESHSLSLRSKDTGEIIITGTVLEYFNCQVTDCAGRIAFIDLNKKDEALHGEFDKRDLSRLHLSRRSSFGLLTIEDNKGEVHIVIIPIDFRAIDKRVEREIDNELNELFK